MELRGDHFRIASINDNILGGGAGPEAARLVLLIDDGLRRTFVSKYQYLRHNIDPEQLQTIRIQQPVAEHGGRIGRIGSLTGATRFDQFGIRTYSLVTPKGKINVVQGITEVSPLFTRIQGLKSSDPYIWDMRIATNSIPRRMLSEILYQHLGREDQDQRLAIVKLYIQAERYHEAERELTAAIQDFPDLENLKQELVAIKQFKAKQMLDDIKRRKESGQHTQVKAFLDKFPTEGIANETLIEVQEILEEYDSVAGRAQRIKDLISTSVDTLQRGPQRDKLLAFQDELDRDLGYDTIGRLTAFLNLADDAKVEVEDRLTDAQKLSLAVSGWLLGSENSINNLAVSMSLIEVRRLVREYLATDTADGERRQQILNLLKSLEGATPQRIAQLLLHIAPPLRTIELERQIALATGIPDPGKSKDDDRQPNAQRHTKALEKTRFGMLERTVATPSGNAEYIIQLPPEYHPHRQYPAIVTLHASGTTAEMQLDWWAGTYRPELQRRVGQAGRHGYVVIAPKWGVSRQRTYGYSFREHAVVLASLRDAIKRFSIDTDRVFLTGHEIGGDAAWDIGLAHPDLWAGVIPFGAIADYGKKRSPKYLVRCWQNAKHVPLYFVGGELAERSPSSNEYIMDRYLKHIGYDTMIVEFLGRGNESFHDEILRLFDWMNLHERDFFPKSFEARTMRSWDNFFWWIEVDELPERANVTPMSWPTKNAAPMVVESDIKPTNALSVKSAAKNTTVWLSPKMLDLNERIKIRINNAPKSITAVPNVETLLEDVRSRGDRQHPFWAKQTFLTRRKPKD